MKKFILLMVLSLTTLVGCQAPFGVDDAELLYESSRVIVGEYNQFLREERTVNSYTNEELMIKVRRNDEYLKFVKALFEEAKEEQAKMDQAEEDRLAKEEARREAERQELLATIRRQLAEAQAAGDTVEVARLQALIDLLLGTEPETPETPETPDAGDSE